MLLVLPAFAFCALFLILYSMEQLDAHEMAGVRLAYLKACILWGAFAAISSEMLGLLHAITSESIIILWGLFSLILVIAGWRQRAFHQAWSRLKLRAVQGHDWTDALMLGIMVALSLFLLSIALKAVPNNSDSMLYHMSRVMHWIQNRSLGFYSTQYQAQLWSPPWAEYVILHLRLLSGTDQVANLVQYFSMIGSLIGVTVLAGMLGAGLREQLLSAFFVISIPMGVLQSTSTQNDYAVGFWLVCTAVFVVLSKKKRLSTLELMALMISIALGMLTKMSYYFYALPLLLWFFIPRLRGRSPGASIKEVLAFTGVAALFNAGYWARNFITYGFPFGPNEWVGGVSEVRLDPRMWISAVLKQASLHFVSTIPKLNDIILTVVQKVHDLLGIGIGDYVFIPGWNHEDLAGNPLHMLLVMFSLIILFLVLRREGTRNIVKFATVLLFGFGLISVLLVFLPYYIRFHLPFFVLWGVVFGAVLQYLKLGRWVHLASIMLLISSIPWLVFNSTRSVVAFKPYTRLGGGIFRETPEAILFANWHNLRQPYSDAAETIRELECKQVGLRIDSHDIEYPFWRLLGAPESGVRIEAVGGYRYLERYEDPSFEPCVIICSRCGDLREYLGVLRYRPLGEGFVLFVDPDFVPEVHK